MRAGWRRRIGVSDEGVPVYEPPCPEAAPEIRVRMEYGRRLVRDARGEALLSEMSFLTRAPVGPGDIIVYDGREWPVMAARVICGLDGEELHRECRLYWQRSASARGTTG